jgi:hypothetical protein
VYRAFRELRRAVTSTLAARLFCDTTVFMSRQSVIPKKKRGPPPTGKGEPIMVRMHKPQLSRLDDWIAGQGDNPSRPEAIRRLLEHALGAGKRRK